MMWLKKFLDKHKLLLLGLVVLAGVLVFAVVAEKELRTNVKIPIPDDKNMESNGDLVLVEDVVDGDTIRVKIEKESVLVRMLGVDAEELNSKPGTRANCLAVSAKETLSSLIDKRYVALKDDPLNEDKDKYGRYLRYVYLDDQNINLKIVEMGYARYYREFPISLKDEFTLADDKGKMVGICN